MKNDLSAFELDKITQAAHEVNRTWQQMLQEAVDQHWDLLSDKEKQIARNSVIGVIVQDYGAEQTHDAWVAEKKSQGWTVGRVKDPTAKTHPCLVSWNELPIEQQAKDQLWVDTVRNFVKHFWRIPKQ